MAEDCSRFFVSASRVRTHSPFRTFWLQNPDSWILAPDCCSYRHSGHLPKNSRLWRSSV